jgi:glycosyltransferase involved in cell wall biosynthesis
MREHIRERHRIPQHALVYTAFGTMTPEKRIPEIVRALAAVTEWVPDARLLLVGQAVGHYDPRTEARAHGVEDRVTITGFVRHEDVPHYLAASDVCLCLRWPTSRETSAAWLRCLGAGRATITTDLAHTTDVPTLDPRSWTVLYAHREASDVFEPSPPVEPVAVSVNMLDEEHSLLLAMRRLGTDARLRNNLAVRARELWSSRFTLERMAEGYRAAIDHALALPAPDRSALPAHFRANGSAQLVRMLEAIGLPDEKVRTLLGGLAR